MPDRAWPSDWTWTRFAIIALPVPGTVALMYGYGFGIGEFGDYHSYLEVTFAINGIVAGWWDRIGDLLIESKEEIRTRILKELWSMNDALTEELEHTRNEILSDLDDGKHDKVIAKIAKRCRIWCTVAAILISFMLLLLRADCPVSIISMLAFILVPVVVVVGIWGTHKYWIRNLIKKWNSAVEGTTNRAFNTVKELKEE